MPRGRILQEIAQARADLTSRGVLRARPAAR
jgi:hypothetical protein